MNAWKYTSFINFKNKYKDVAITFIRVLLKFLKGVDF